MSYASQTDLEDAFSANEIAQLIAGGRDVDVALAAADAEIDSRISLRYATPLTVDPMLPQIVDCACNIARYKLYAASSDEEIQNRYKAAIAWLRDVAAGNALLPGIPLSTAEGSDDPGQSPPRFGPAKGGMFGGPCGGYGNGFGGGYGPG